MEIWGSTGVVVAVVVGVDVAFDLVVVGMQVTVAARLARVLRGSLRT